jgi:hypothetical protein
VAGGSGADSMLWFLLDRGSDETKRCRKMKRRQRAHLGSMRRKRDMARQHGDVGRRRGGTEEGKWRRRCSWADTNLTGENEKKNHTVDLAATNVR